MKMRKVVSLILLLCIGRLYAQSLQGKDTSWVDSVFRTMSSRDRIAQLFMIRVQSSGDTHYYKQISKEICDNRVGGIAFFKGSPVKEAEWTNHFQANADVPLLIAIDGEWGLAMRLDSTISYPRQLALGAIQNDSLIYKMGVEIAHECKRIGIELNFAPDVDINSNPRNPVINSRSFGEDKYKVAKKGLAYMKGMQDNGILTCAKHFPGHGDTDVDSHLELPVISHSNETIDTLDLFPFKEMIKNKVSSVMTAHLNIPALDTACNSIASLSKGIVTDLLKNKMGFDGLCITDALDMKGVANSHKGGSAALDALIAGNDILLLPVDLAKAIDTIEKAIDSGIVSQQYVDEKCKKILRYKQMMGLQHFKPIVIKGLYKDVNSPQAIYLQQQLYENAITLVLNKDSILPLKRLDTLRLAVLSIGDTITGAFKNVLSHYAAFDFYQVSQKLTQTDIDSFLYLLKPYNYIIIGIHNTNQYANKNFGITESTIAFIDSLKKGKKIILDVFANPYSLARFKNTRNIDALIESYQSTAIVEKLSAQLIFGGISVSGKLPVTVSPDFPINRGIQSIEPIRLKYTVPLETGINPKDLLRIDSLVYKGINARAFPGCVVLVAKDGKVIYDKAFGHHTYQQDMPEKTNDIFDMASITKIMASTMAIMKLYEQGKLGLDKELVDYLPSLKKTNKAHIRIRDLMAHQAGLQAWIPFFKETIKNGKVDSNIYRKKWSKAFPYRVAENLYIRKDYPDLIMKEIIKSPLNDKKEYLYSDMGFYLMMKIVEKVSGKSFETYLQENLYKPLGMSSTSFRPRERFGLDRIVPTEIDTVWRKQLLHGDVNDQGAAMMGGICGHAGLFSDMYDMATMLQMLLQKGEYAGRRYLQDSTITEFTKCQFPANNNRRALGFDKPALSSKDVSPCCKSASSQSYGHSGFTGTFFWVDPVENLIYIFLSNRVYPDANNKKLTEMNIRTDIQQTIYDAIAKSKK